MFDSVESQARAVTSKNALFSYFDIESLNNVFTVCFFVPKGTEPGGGPHRPVFGDHSVEVFYIIDKASTPDWSHSPVDTVALAEHICRRNPAYKGSPGDISFYDLTTHVGIRRFHTVFGNSAKMGAAVAKPPFNNALVTDFDAGYDPFRFDPFILGYNSSIYDVTLLAQVLSQVYVTQDVYESFEDSQRLVRAMNAHLSAANIREHNNALFSDEFKSYMPKYLVAREGGWNSLANQIRVDMLASGRYIDVSNFNEAQSRVGLDRLLGTLGHQILTSNKLSSNTATISSADEFFDLVAYNVSDVVGLWLLFQDPTYANGFDLKQGLIDKYWETRFESDPASGGVVEVRGDRLSADATSAKLVSRILAPDASLPDLPVVSFQYPEVSVAERLGIPSVNVLDEQRRFFYDNVVDPGARAAFDQVYEYYKSIEGKNFNDSDVQAELMSLGSAKDFIPYDDAARMGVDPSDPRVVYNLFKIPKRPNNVFYYYRDGSPSNCFATFSTGGIHGAEVNMARYRADMKVWEKQEALINHAKSLVDGDATELRNRREFEYEGRVVKWNAVLTSSSKLKKAFWKPNVKPVVFKESSDGSTKLNPRYNFTSIGEVVHEDFTSYYPNMLRNLNAFFNESLGEDRYAIIFQEKETYGRLMKDSSYSEQERKAFSILREGTKLILNTASGAGDTTYKNNIRMNNRIISMRIIGQLLTWRIAQAQTFEGGSPISTNTDGIYIAVGDGYSVEENNRILKAESASVNVDIEPEVMRLVSKDSNNRLEMVARQGCDPWEYPIVSASGGTLACFAGPSPRKSLAHAALIDTLVAYYLRLIAGGFVFEGRALSIEDPFDVRVGRMLYDQIMSGSDRLHVAKLAQHILAASPGKCTYPFTFKGVGEYADGTPRYVDPGVIQNFNRVFFVKPGTAGAVLLANAGAYKVTPQQQATRQRKGLQSVLTHPDAKFVLGELGLSRDNGGVPFGQDVAVRKISGIDMAWPCVIDNRSLHELGDDELDAIIGSLDPDVYVGLAEATFNKNWQNIVAS